MDKRLRTPWSPEEVERLRAGWEAGESVDTIAHALDRTPRAVTARIARIRRGGPTDLPPRFRRWTADDLERQRAGWQAGETVDAIARALDRTPGAVTAHMARIRSGGGAHLQGGLRWTADDLERLRAGWQAGETVDAIARALGRSTSAVQMRLRGVRSAGRADLPPRFRPWTADDLERLRAGWQAGEAVDAIARALGRSPVAVLQQMSRIRSGGRTDLPPRARWWTLEEIAFLRTACAAGMTIPRMAKHLQRTTHAVSTRLWAEGLKRSKGTRRVRQAWSSAEDERIRADETAGLSAGSCAIGLGRSVKEVRMRARALGCGHRWTFEDFTPDEDALIRAVYTARSPIDELIADGRTIRAVRIRAHHLGVAQRPPPPTPPGPRASRSAAAQRDARADG